MFLGQFQHNIDYKSRTSIPKKFREELKDGAVLTRGLDGCLFLYSIAEWQILSDRIKDLPLTGSNARNFSRYLYSGAQEVKFDSLGRIVIPDFLLAYAKIEKKVVIIGVLNRIEIWADTIWHKQNKKMLFESEATAEKLSGTGI